MTKPGFYCPAWDWSLGAPLQMVRFVAFTPLYGWGQAEGRAPVSVWAIPEDHGQKQVDEDVATIASVVNAATPALEPACGMSTTSLAVQLHSKIVVQLGDELFIIHNWRGRKRGVKVRPAVPWCAHGAKQNKTMRSLWFLFCFVSLHFSLFLLLQQHDKRGAHVVWSGALRFQCECRLRSSRWLCVVELARSRTTRCWCGTKAPPRLVCRMHQHPRQVRHLLPLSRQRCRHPRRPVLRPRRTGPHHRVAPVLTALVTVQRATRCRPAATPPTTTFPRLFCRCRPWWFARSCPGRRPVPLLGCATDDCTPTTKARCEVRTACPWMRLRTRPHSSCLTRDSAPPSWTSRFPSFGASLVGTLCGW